MNCLVSIETVVPCLWRGKTVTRKYGIKKLVGVKTTSILRNLVVVVFDSYYYIEN